MMKDLAIASDELLCMKYETGDRLAFEELINRWRPQIYSLAYRYLLNREDALDVSQEVFIKLFTKLGTFRGKSSFKTWLYRLTLNSIYDHRRKQKNLIELDYIDDTVSVDNPEASFHYSEDFKLLKAAIRKLPDKERNVLILKEYTDLTFNEISEVLDCPVSTIKSRLYRSLCNLKDLMSNGKMEGRA